MLTLVSRKWWALVLRGALAILLGVLAFLWPSHTLKALFMLVGLFLILDGFITSGLALSHRKGVTRWWIFLIEGIAGLLVGLFAFIWPQTVAVVVVTLLGIWALITGVLEILAGVRLRAMMEGEWLMISVGILSLAFGLLLILIPASAVVALLWLVAVYFILFGIVLVVLGLKVRPLSRRYGEDGL